MRDLWEEKQIHTKIRKKGDTVEKNYIYLLTRQKQYKLKPEYEK